MWIHDVIHEYGECYHREQEKKKRFSTRSTRSCCTNKAERLENRRWAGRLLWVSAAAADARSLLETIGKWKMVGETVITCSKGDFFIVTVGFFNSVQNPMQQLICRREL